MRDEIAKRLLELETRQEALDCERLRLKTLWNEAAPVNKLPLELIVHIFKCFARRKPRWDDEHISEISWIRLMPVCRFWRDVACSTPTLWRSIDVRRSLDWLQLCLSLSASCTIDLSFHRSAIDASAIRVLFPHASRIRDLIFRRFSSWWIEPLTILLSDNLPSLETLSFPEDLSPQPVHDVIWPLDVLAAARYPLLSDLHLAKVTAPRDPGIYAHLCSLTLWFCPCDFTTDEFLDFLAANTVLEHLCLQYTLQRQLNAGTLSRASHRALVTLPNLMYLTIRDEPPHLSNFLVHLDLPRLKIANIHGFLDDSAEPGVLPYTLKDMVPADTTKCLPLLTRATWADVSAQPHEYKILAKFPQESDWGDDVVLSAHTDGIIKDALTLSHVLEHDVLTLLRGARLTHLTVACTHADEDVLVWAATLPTFMTLKSLGLHGEGAPTPFWLALRQLSEAAVAAGDDLPCPVLRSVALDGHLDADEELLEEIVECLRVRAEGELKLDDLDLILYHEEDQDIGALRAAYAPLLSGLVEQFMYDDWVEVHRTFNMSSDEDEESSGHA